VNKGLDVSLEFDETEGAYMINSNIWGEVFWSKDDLVIRHDGSVYSVWLGRRLEITSRDKRPIERFVG
jgi:hypothetical protein